MPKLIATQSLRYAGRELVADEEFDASDDDARVLKAVRKAADAPKKKPPAHPTKTRSLKAENDGDAGERAAGARYRRSDMRPED